MDKKVGILTYHSSDNFGSVLQAYALSKYLSGQNVDCEIIDYRKETVRRLYRIFQPLDSRYHLLTNLYCIPYYKRLKKRENSFEFFRRTMLPLSESRYTEEEQLRQCKYTQYIVGSDQVWNMDIVDFDLSYMLAFTDADKISYGASFGPREKSRECLCQFSQYLRDFRRISVRENSSKTMCEQGMGVSAEVVCDPVFLLDRGAWEGAAVKYAGRPKHYVLAYFPGGASTEIEGFSRTLAKEKGYDRVLLMPEWRNAFRPGRKAYDCGPAEFLDLILNADCICTSSFHGTAFSLLFGKEFCVSLNQGDERISTILSYVPEREKTYLGEIVRVSPCMNLPALKRTIEASKEFLSKTVCP